MSTYVPESTDEAEFLAAYDPSKFPVTVVTVDLAVFRVNPDDHWAYDVLLIERGNWPYKGRTALPGGFINPDETTEQAAMRELQEETGITETRGVKFVGVLDRPDRDPRGRAISHLFAAWGTGDAVASDDAAKAHWVPLIPAYTARNDMAFDHGDALVRAMKAMRLG